MTKLVKEHIIFEKFVEDSDPIKDMGIGLKSIYKNLKRGDILKIKKKLVMEDGDRTVYPINSYLLILDVENINSRDKNIFYNYYKNENDFENDKEEEHDVWTWDFEFFKEFFEKVGEKNISESLNEKFVEDSDPIHDLGIGLIRKFNEIKEALLKEAMPIFWEEKDIREDELIIQLDATDYLMLYDNLQRITTDKWSKVGVFSNFEVRYYIDIELKENIVERMIIVTNSDIKDFEYTDRKIICDNPIDIDAEELSHLIYSDLGNYDYKNAVKEAWEIAKVEHEKEQKRLSYVINTQ
jgi:hypothetical protein